MLKNFDSIIQSLNSSKFFAALIMLMLNIGSRYVDLKFSKSQEYYLKNILGKQILIFAISWMGTRDIYIALITTFVFTLLTDFILNEDSNMCIMPSKLTNIEKQFDLNNDGVVSEEELRQAKEIIRKDQLNKSTMKQHHH